MFDIAGLNRFNMIWACVIRHHHRCIGENFPRPHSPEMKLLLHVHIAIYAEFLLCVFRGTNCNTTYFCLSKVLSASEALLSRQFISGLNTLLANSS